MIIKYKSCHNVALDSKLYSLLKYKKDFKRQYYLYMWDDACKGCERPKDFYEKECNGSNTWNYNLDIKDIRKDSIMNLSKRYGFGDYSIDNVNNRQYIVKAVQHIYSTDKNYGQARLCNIRNEIRDIDRSKFVIQPLLRNKNGEELNIFVLQNLYTNHYNFLGIMLKHNASLNINRKQNRLLSMQIINLGDVLQAVQISNLEEMCKSINLQYGRIEMINDDELGWCLMDINNTPGGGPLTNAIYPLLARMIADMES